MPTPPRSDPAQPMRLIASVRLRLLLLALLPMLLILPVMLWVAVSNLSGRTDDVLRAKVAGELTIAHQHLDGLMQARLAAITALGDSTAMAGQGDLPALLAERRRASGLDFLIFVGDDGRVVVPKGAPPVTEGYDPAAWPIIASARGGSPRVGIDIFAAGQLQALSPRLAASARLRLVDTTAAAPTARAVETRGMMIHAAAPAPGGVLVGGVLLNRNLHFIDEINDLVYPVARRAQAGQGTATLFLDDVRVSTNVRMFGGERALGTRVSAAVRARVLGQGETWLNRAFVVNDWYISAYEPVVDSFGARVGMLYVGVLERPHAEARAQTIRTLAIGFLAVLALTVPVLLRWAQGIFRPLERMTRTIARVDAGDLSARTGPLGRHDEIARVAARLDDLLGQLAARENDLRELNESLEARVTARTRDLEAANRQLREATAQLVLSEKLASLGEVTAGVAHEINNPLAVIQGNLDVIEAALGAAAQPLTTEFTLISEQVQTIHVMVSKLLHFSRPDEFPAPEGAGPVEPVLRGVEPLVAHMLQGHRLRLDLDAPCQVAIAPSALQQVLVNLISNAIEAMPDGGDLTITARCEGGHLRVEVADTGSGMDSDTVRRAFDPFFTGKPGTGTGLGLSLSQKTIAGAGGRLAVCSTPGQGSVFTITLPIAGSD